MGDLPHPKLTTSGKTVIPASIAHHLPVMVEQVLEMLSFSVQGKAHSFDTIVDGTVGGGGHAATLLSRLSPSGSFFCFDRDPKALAMAKNRLGSDPRLTFVRNSYAEIGNYLPPQSVNAILLDLGLSTDQLESESGFSYLREAPLDMRFDLQLETNAFIVLNHYPKAQLRDIFFRFGEEPFAPRIASRIVEIRKEGAINNTKQLAEVIMDAVPERFRMKTLARIFQAIRIEVNRELEHLERGLEACWKVLQDDGVFCVLSYHSLEDRRVKRFFAGKSKGCICPPTLPLCVCGKKPEAKVLTSSPVRPSPKEIRQNPAARSARLRAALKINRTAPAR